MSSQAIVDDIRGLYQLLTPVNVIARTLHLSEHIVRHAIEFGRLPEEQPNWKQGQSTWPRGQGVASG